MNPPFVVLALPRSRTAWLSEYLSYGDWICGHEESRYFRTIEDVKAWLAQPCTGSADTLAAPWWRLLASLCPGVRVVVIRRPVSEVVESLMRLDLGLDRETLTRGMRRLDAKLAQIAVRMPNALSVRFADLVQEDVCAKVFEHCLPYPHDAAWWRSLESKNVQCSMPAMMRYAQAFSMQMNRMGAIAKQTILAQFAMRDGAPPDGVGFQSEPFDAFLADGRAAFAEHSISVGESPDSFLGKNIDLMRALDRLGNMQIMTARSNGRMFGYLMTILSPSLESPKIMTAIHTAFFASTEFPGLGLKLQRAALSELKKRGVHELFFRAGTRGSGLRAGALYRRLGAEKDGELYRLNLGVA